MIRGMETIPESHSGPVVLIHEHVTGGGAAVAEIPPAWIAEGSAMRLALARDFAAAGARVLMTLDTRIPCEPGPWTIQRIAPGTAAGALPALVRQAESTIPIAPETHGTLCELAATIARSGGRSLGSSPASIELAADKLRMAEHLSRADVPTPSTIRVEPRRGLPRTATYPAILKPVDGAGCVDTFLVRNPDDPIVAAFPDGAGLLQPFIGGEPRSASFLVRSGRAPILLGVGLQSIPVVDGRLAYRGGTILTDDLPNEHPSRRAVASVPGLAGFVGVDYIHDPMTARAVVIEINPRPTTSCVGLVASLGRGQLARAWLELVGGKGSPRLTSHDLPRRSVSFRRDGTPGIDSPLQTAEALRPWA